MININKLKKINPTNAVNKKTNVGLSKFKRSYWQQIIIDDDNKIFIPIANIIDNKKVFPR